MIDLKSLAKPSADRPIIATIFGEGGMGKTTLAAMFPAPVFIRTEDGSASLTGHDEVFLFPVAESVADVMEQIQSLAEQEHPFKTVVIDSVTQFEKIAIREILNEEPNPKAKNMAAALGGYGKAYLALDRIHQELREACGYLAAQCDMNVIFICHAALEELDLPDLDKFSRHAMALHKNRQVDCSHHYSSNVDLVGFIRLETFTRGSEDGKKKRAISNGAREIICFPVASNVSKNRFNITEPLAFTFDGGNPFQQYLKKE
jgi:hypothetical protein